MFKKLVLASFLVLTACNTTPQTKMTGVYTGAGTAYTAADLYVQQPDCATATTAICSKANIRDKIETAATTLNNAVVASGANVNDQTVSGLEAALAAFNTLMNDSEIQNVVKALITPKGA